MRLLVITHMFPPCRYANAKRPGAVVRGALGQGWRVDVLTSRLGMAEGMAEEIVHPNLRISRIPDPLERLCGAFAGNFRVFRLVTLAVNGLAWPDEYVWWSRRALRYCRREDYDRVLVFLLPASLLLSGMRSGLVDRRWVLDYQEPVTPFYLECPRRSPWQRAMLPALRRLERRTLSAAGRMIFTAQTSRQRYIELGLAPRELSEHIPYFYDSGLFDLPSPPPPSQFTIGYLGTFDWRGARSPEVFLRSLARFLENRPEARPHTRFVFHGHWLPEHDRHLDELRLRDVVRLNPHVPFALYVDRLRQCSVLLLVVSPVHRLFMPSKIVDYLGARRPILAYVPRDSEMRQVLEHAGMGALACDESDVACGAGVLEQLWDAYRNGCVEWERAPTDFWSSRQQLPRYLNLLADMGSAL